MLWRDDMMPFAVLWCDHDVQFLHMISFECACSVFLIGVSICVCVAVDIF